MFTKIIGGLIATTATAALIYGAGDASARPARCDALSATPAVQNSIMCNPNGTPSGGGVAPLPDRGPAPAAEVFTLRDRDNDGRSEWGFDANPDRAAYDKQIHDDQHANDNRSQRSK